MNGEETLGYFFAFVALLASLLALEVLVLGERTVDDAPDAALLALPPVVNLVLLVLVADGLGDLVRLLDLLREEQLDALLGLLQLLLGLLLLRLLEDELLEAAEGGRGLDLGVAGEVLVELVDRRLHRTLEALAVLALSHLLEPVEGRIVDCLSHVEPEVEPSVVGASKDDHELVLPVLGLGDAEVRVLLLEVVGVDEGGLVPQELLAGEEVVGEESHGLPLDDLLVLVVDGVPEFGLALVDEVDAREVQVLSVPAEEGLPTPHVAVGSIHPPHLRLHRLRKQRVQAVQIPPLARPVHQRVQ